METKAEEKERITHSILIMPAECDIRINVWHPKKKQLDWLLGLEQLKVAVHPDVPTILNLYNGHAVYDSPLEVTVFMHDKDLASLRGREELKHLYEEWYKRKEGKEVKK